ncbi:MAG: hypothetical protein US53_C0036G0004 [Candidatus Woesebacteria bacterium GW2011_GWA1_37_7]|uniref:Uncharacterized protein n=1 Tax=Candidatus Woesebacteria bacterium GW2011_GWA1_37_7 TaxID=1618545 RepID=A0A0G0H3T1_9BACT|nr:MAG: hypothetical protein US53_C0036G0004 [Candidatus Woesebacteria bacterium GW2011_GWA1_37_7]
MFGQKYWWGVGDTEQGNRVVKGPFASQSEAYTQMDGLRNCRYFDLDTRDRARAKAELRAKLTGVGYSHDNVLNRMFSKIRGGRRNESRGDELENDLGGSDNLDDDL